MGLASYGSCLSVIPGKGGVPAALTSFRTLLQSRCAVNCVPMAGDLCLLGSGFMKRDDLADIALADTGCL